MITISSKINEYQKSGSIIFVYTIQSTESGKKGEAELQSYKETQGSYYRESENKEPLYFSQRLINPGAELTLTRSGRYTVLEDLTGKAAAIEQANTQNLGKLLAIQQFCGMTKAQMTERLLATF